ncbi:MAG: hypothetical protein WAM62_15020 [Pseudolabrys sp.]
MATINITPNASAQELRRELDDYARALGVTRRTLTAKIYAYSVANKGEFTGALKNARPSPGDHIGAEVTDEIAKELTRWAKGRGTPRGVHCRYILEKALEIDILDAALNPRRR